MIRSGLINMIREKAQRKERICHWERTWHIEKHSKEVYEPTKSRAWAQGKKKAIQAGPFQTGDS